MFIWEAILLGIVQGLTEFLPISSSAHLILIPKMLGWEAPLLNSLTFNVALHLGTLLAVGIYFRKELAELARAAVRAGWKRDPWGEPKARLVWFIVLGTVPAVIAGLTMEDKVAGTFRSPAVIAVCLIGVSLIMGIAERWTVKCREMESMKLGDVLLIGLAQALALMPGVSRSGITIAAGLALRFKREEAARFSFLLGIPVIFGAAVFELKKLAGLGLDQSAITLLAGMLTAALAGYAGIKFLLAYLRYRTLYVFIIYRLILGAAVLIWVAG
ncbi:undecaprenyl-diphosphatase UppP [bacterium]|nr:undecaprenyl-diphosphatase UppP [bacterium]